MRLPELPSRNRFDWGGTLSYYFSGACRRQEFIGALERFKVLRSGDGVSGQPESSVAGSGTGCGAGWERAGVLHLAHVHPSAGQSCRRCTGAREGDFTYGLDAHSGDEAAEVTGAFNRMPLQFEDDAAGITGSGTVGHDRTHGQFHLARFAPLAAIVANADFLCESRLSSDQREELYQEIRAGVNQMTDLIDSLLEFSRTRESLRPTYGNVRDSVGRVVQAIRLHPEFHQVRITTSQEGNSSGWFDAKKLERALYNLLLNSCEAVVPEAGSIEVRLSEVRSGVEIRVSDTGRGIPELIRSQLFEPFVSQLFRITAGDVAVEKTSPAGTVFRLLLPLALSSESVSERWEEGKARTRLARIERPQPE
jgi:Histidine kinase-, DNA gyrase B-, and HSP90-like ATPase